MALTDITAMPKELTTVKITQKGVTTMNSKNSTPRSTSESSTMKGKTMSTRYTKAKNYQTIVKHGLVYSFGCVTNWRGEVRYLYKGFTGTTLDDHLAAKIVESL